MEYIDRIIDKYLEEWKDSSAHKPLLLRGARQVGKSSAVRHLGRLFENFAEVNFERLKGVHSFFEGDIDVRLITAKLSKFLNVDIVPGKTLLFFDEIQECPQAIMALRFFWEDLPELHVVAAGSLLEFTLEELPTFGVGRIRSLFMYPLTFDEFLVATGNGGLLAARRSARPTSPLDSAFHDRLVEQFRIYMLVGGMPEAVTSWVATHNFERCRRIHNDIILTYEDDFNKYRRRISPELLRIVMHGVCHQTGCKLSFTKVSTDFRSTQIRSALRLLTLAGICTPVTMSSGNGVPLEAEENAMIAKYLFLDSGLLLAILSLDGSSSQTLIQTILAGEPQDVINKGGIVEMVVGLEILRYKEPIRRHKMHYWLQTGNSLAEVDYLEAWNARIIPIEVKSSTQGGMKSLWQFMRVKHLDYAVRTSLENFGTFTHIDPHDDGAVRHVDVVPVYAIQQMLRRE